MRRTAEWLLLPFFLLPIGIAVGFHVWVRDSYHSELEAFESSGRARAGVWLADGRPAHHLVALFGRDRRDAEAAAGDHGVRFRVGDFEGSVWGERETPLPRNLRAWRQADSFRSGLSPTALADPATRLAIETGRIPEAGAETDEATTESAELLEAPEIRRLSSAPLPAATKRNLVQRWIDQGGTLPHLAEASEGGPLRPNGCPPIALRTDNHGSPFSRPNLRIYCMR